MEFSTVATLAGYKSHYTQDGKRTLCGREASNGTSGTDMCKACEKSAARMQLVAETTAKIVEEIRAAAPVEPTAETLTEITIPRRDVVKGDMMERKNGWAKIASVTTYARTDPRTGITGREWTRIDCGGMSWDAYAADDMITVRRMVAAPVEPTCMHGNGPECAPCEADDAAAVAEGPAWAPTVAPCADWERELMGDTAHCPNCQQTHPTGDADLHGAPCYVCDSDGHAGCQHVFTTLHSAESEAIDRAACEESDDLSEFSSDHVHGIFYVGADETMCGRVVRALPRIKTADRVTVDPTDVTCSVCQAENAVLEAEDNAPEPSDDECHRIALEEALTAAERHVETPLIRAHAPARVTRDTTAVKSSAYPRSTDDGREVWACCESSIGAPCQHRTGAREPGEVMVVVEPSRTDRRKVVAWLLGLGTELCREFRADKTGPLHVAYWAQVHGVRPADGSRKFKWQEHETLSLAPARF